MKDEEDKDLDQLFKNRLQDSENLFAYNEDDWLALEAKLDKKDNRNAAIFWLRTGIGVAAMLLLCFGIWFLNQTPSRGKDTLADKKSKDIEKNIPTETARASDAKSNDETAHTAQENPSANKGPVNQNQVDQPILANNGMQPQPKQNSVGVGIDSNKISIAVITSNHPITTAITQEPIKTPIDSIAKNNQAIAVAEPIVIANNPVKEEEPVVKKPKESKKQPITFAVNVIAASDLNGISTLKETEVGTNYGLLFNVGISKKFTVQTGLIYSNKPYASNTDSYKVTYTSPYAAKYTPTSVYVQCKMFDLPLNLDYQLFENQSNKFSIGTGLSSYIMLHENYEYNFDPASNYATRNYEVPNSKAYLFSILNLSVTYERKLTNRIGLTAQPYLKVPLRAVGYGDVKLQSVGLSLGLKMNFNKSLKKNSQ